MEAVVGPGAELGEGPVWDDTAGVLWWLDIRGERLHRFDPATGEDTRRALGRPVGALALRPDGGLVLATPQGFERYDPATGTSDLLAAVEADRPSNRMNDGKCDRSGRFWAGTMSFDADPGAGSLYRLDGVEVTQVLGGVTISNGLAWSGDDRTLFYIDTPTGRIDAFDYDAASGAIGGRRTLVQIESDDGVPDGMCIDAEDALWVALYGGGAVRRYSPDGVLLDVLTLPVSQVTCCTFGGDDLGDLYITTAAEDFGEEERRDEPEAGSLFRTRPGVTGVPTRRFHG